jgi:DNA-binding transcriptional MocR family regulator
MQNWAPSLAGETGPKYAAIADAIAAAIRTGELRPGERLPPQRALAARLQVDLTTVTRAYGLARQAGLIEGAGKLGSFVRNDAMPQVFGETTSEAGMNVPPQPAFALLPEAIRSGTAELLRAGRHSPILQYQPSAGNMLDRTAAAAALTARGIPTAPAEVAITAGAQNALHALLATAFEAGDTICCGAFVYAGMKALARRLRLRLEPVAGDAEGLLPDAVEQAFRRGARAVYLTPTNDNPTTATIGMARRAAIVAAARRHGAVIIEDDAYGLLPSLPPAPIASLAPELTWHIGGTSKIISPVLRVAHLRVPAGGRMADLVRDVHETSVMAPPLNAALVTLWLRNGSFDRLVAAVRAEAIARQRIAARALKGLRFAADAEGYHLWMEVPARADVERLVAAVRPLGLSAVAGDTFAISPGAGRSHLRLSMGGPIDHARLERALDHAASLCGAGSSPG